MNNTRSAYNIARGLALKLDLGIYFPFEKQEEMLDWQLKQVGSSLEEMQRIGVKTKEREADDLYFAENENVTFSTDSGKIELYSKYFEGAGFDPLPNMLHTKSHRTGFTG